MVYDYLNVGNEFLRTVADPNGIPSQTQNKTDCIFRFNYNKLYVRFRENGKMALRSQSFNERRSVASVARAQPHSEGELSDEADDAPTNLAVNGKRKNPFFHLNIPVSQKKPL